MKKRKHIFTICLVVMLLVLIEKINATLRERRDCIYFIKLL